MTPSHVIIILSSLLIALAIRVWSLLPAKNSHENKRRPGQTCSIAIFLGSGGHTSEMRTLVSALDFARYTPRRYIACHGDEMSLRAIGSIESERRGKGSGKAWDVLLLPRARRVGQSLPSTAASTAYTTLVTFYRIFLLPLLKHPFRPYADVLLINGPGTCVVLVLVSWIRRVIGLRYTKIIYVESWARVDSLSLSAKILKPFCDSFVVQWPKAGKEGECKGWLV